MSDTDNMKLTKREHDLIAFYDKGDTACPPCDNVPELLARLFREYNIKVRGNVLDAGCGHGRFAGAVSELAAVNSVYGVDYSPGRIARAANLNPSEKCHFIVGSVYEYEPPVPIDTIAVFETLEHLAYPVRAIHHLSNLLSDGSGYVGEMFGSCPIGNHFHAHLKVWRDVQEFEWSFPMLEVLWQESFPDGKPRYVVWRFKGW